MVIAIDIRLIGKKRTGDETVFFHLTKALLQLDKENHYRLLTDERDPAKLAVLRARLGLLGERKAEIISLRGSNRFIWNLLTVPLYLMRERVDIYHTQYILPFFIPERTKAVTLIHDVSFRAYPHLIAWSDRVFLRFLIPRSLARADKVLAVSQFTKDEIIKYYHMPAEKISVIPNAIQDIFLRPSPTDFEILRKRYQLPEKYILYVGTLQPRKNLPFLLEAFALLRKRLPECRLVIVGSTTARNVDPVIEKLIREKDLKNSVLFPGYVSETDLPGVIRHARVFVFPSLYEGFGIPILEAMSQEVPVIAADIPSLRETGGEALTIIQLGDIAELAEKMYNFFIESDTLNRSAAIEKGLRRASFYSWKDSAHKLLEVYQSL